MMFSRTRQLLISGVLALSLLVTACGGGTSEPSRWDGAQDSTRNAPTQTTEQEPVKGGQLNRFFPSASGEYQRVFVQEKTGSALAKLKKAGKEVATLAISDTANNPRAAEKFKTASTRIGGYPAVEQGKKSSILVGDRFQVTVTSKTPADFSASDRKAWLQKFNLSGLARLK